MKADPKVIADLQTVCGLLDTLAEQYRVDGALLRGIDLAFLAKKFYPKWHMKAEAHLNLFIKRLIDFETDPNFEIGRPLPGGDVRALLTRDCDLATKAFNFMTQARKTSWNVRADGVTDLYEHAIQTIEKQIFHMEIELKLIASLGLQDYIASRLENG